MSTAVSFLAIFTGRHGVMKVTDFQNVGAQRKPLRTAIWASETYGKKQQSTQYNDRAELRTCGATQA